MLVTKKINFNEAKLDPRHKAYYKDLTLFCENRRISHFLHKWRKPTVIPNIGAVAATYIYNAHVMVVRFSSHTTFLPRLPMLL